jgi:hypothetical protein
MESSDFPDIYGDNAAVTLGNHGASITFFLSEPMDDDPRGKPVVRVRMSLEMVRSLSALLAGQLEVVDRVLAEQATQRSDVRQLP